MSRINNDTTNQLIIVQNDGNKLYINWLFLVALAFFL